MSTNKMTLSALDLFHRAQRLSVLLYTRQFSGTVYVSEGLEAFAEIYELPVHQEIWDFENGTGIYLVATYDGVEFVQPVAWEEKW